MTAMAREKLPLSLVALVAVMLAGATAGWWPQVLDGPTALVLVVVAWLSGHLRLAAAPGKPQLPAALAEAAPAVASAPPLVERRAHPRYDLRLTATLVARGVPPRDVEVLNISEGGALCRAANPPPAGTACQLVIEGLGLPVPFEVIAQAGEEAFRGRFMLEGLALAAFQERFAALVEASATRASVR